EHGLNSNRHLHRELAYKVIADYPFFGIGSGNWMDVYPAYETTETYGYGKLMHVHNDYLQLLAEQGIVGFLILGSAILIALGTMLGALRRRRDPLMRGILYGCVTATITFLIHALADFNFHIPANAAMFSVILAMGLIAARMPHDA
ncbi:MAG: O-antigen ligase family protein, partial [Halioglobus sp.]|nr:O-antigen ligase family protein [Halioglobus sp.]